MKIVAEFLSASWSEPLVWTLLHSVWQGFIIAMLLVAAMRIIPSRYSSARYGASTGALLVMLLCSIGTFLYLRSGTSTSESLSYQFTISNTGSSASSIGSYVGTIDQLRGFVESNTYTITLLWLMGTFVFTLRMASGFLYISAVRRNAISISEQLSNHLQTLAAQIGLDRVVAIAQSSTIEVPFVTGYFKPLILIPTGMISGLSTEQLEAILVHELMHIKRNDYVVNIVQSFIEAILFFNPFVWIVSSVIRTEREHCCDDEVIKHSNALAYARALAQLEELKLSNSNLVLSLADNKNQLLKRIKRIMEKSVQNYSIKERILPVLLLVVGLMCASWLTIKSPGSEEISGGTGTVQRDTTKPKEKSSYYFHKKITGRDEEDTNAWRSIEPVEPVEPLEPLEAIDADDYFHIAPIAPIEPLEEFEALAALEHMEGLEALEFAAMPPTPDFMFSFDTIPGSFHAIGDRDWDAFREEFQLKFKQKFGDFYKTHGEEVEKMMRDINKELDLKSGKEWARHAEEMAQRNLELMERQREFQNDAMIHQKRAMENAQLAMVNAQKDQEAQVRIMEKQAKWMEGKMKEFEKALKAELVKDGYLTSDEKIDNIDWDYDGTIEVNGKKIKETDRKKYNELRSKFFKDGGRLRYVE